MSNVTYQGQSLVGILQVLLLTLNFCSKGFPTSLDFLGTTAHHDDVTVDGQLVAYANQGLRRNKEVLIHGFLILQGLA